MTAIILAGGKSTRLIPYTDDIIPKILLPVSVGEDGAMVPLLARLVSQIRRADISDIEVVCNGKNIRTIAPYARRLGARATLQRFEEQWGAVLSADIAFDAIIIDGDNFYYDDDVILNFYEAVKNSSTIAVSSFVSNRTDKYAMIGETIAGRVYKIEEKPASWEDAFIAKGGLLYIPERAILRSSSYRTTTEFVQENIGNGVRSIRVSSKMVDIGTWDDYTSLLRETLHV